MSHKIYLLPFLMFVGIFFSGIRVNAAEWVVLKYGLLFEHISVPELSTFAETGELSASLRAYLRMVNKQPNELREVLTKEIEVDPIILAKVLNSLPGEILLAQVSEVIRTPTHRASRESLRGALVTSALPDGNIRLIEVLENYPTPAVYVEGDRLVEIYNSLNLVLGLLPTITL
ncbi:MAG: alpha/beta hydrolase [Gomphosphaeria aponina SAG 52.96 = DSM 107014]|uniref:Alpha/beta hydrolase n=1 Tax=Gomphosphaeria aponina SAG 52.96 = DSM 107014 TaxID=1521640 RepID=A0A941JP88_9CHRO|nr:alpha/beta hydrolase [Gomphosphaeria aponina SAG 52.96 = DSM 107014]